MVLEISCFERSIVAPFGFKLSLQEGCFILFRLFHAFVQGFVSRVAVVIWDKIILLATI